MEFKGINKLSLLDYPGKVAAILYVDVCNFCCEYCHNWNTLIATEDNEDLFFEDILSFLRKRVGVLDGVVISGGEPTLMPNLEEKIRAIRSLGYAIKLDTNGTHPEVVEDLVNKGLLDYVAMDIKSSLDDYHRFTNNDVLIENVCKTIEFLKQNRVDYEFRMTLIDEYHKEEVIEKVRDLLKGSKRLFLQQFKVSDGVINKNLHPVDEGIANRYVEILSQDIDDVSLRGY